MSDRQQVDFSTVKKQVDVPALFHFLGLLDAMKREEEELIGSCPLGETHGRSDSFHLNSERRIFQCFACKGKGSILDFVAKYLGVGLRDAGVFLSYFNSAVLGEKDGKAGLRRWVEDYTGNRSLPKDYTPPVEDVEEHEHHVAAPPPKNPQTGAAILSFPEALSLIGAGKLTPSEIVCIQIEQWTRLLIGIAKK